MKIATFLYKYDFPTGMAEAEVVTIGEKGQMVIPKQMRDDFNIVKGTKLLIREEKENIIIKPIRLDEKHLLMLLSETTLKKVWDNKYDARWDDVL